MSTETVTNRERRKRYLVCKERGHSPSGVTLTSNPPWSVCQFCGTNYRTEVTVIEANVPGRTLCSLDHHRGVECPNEPECIWGG